jgi:hypothetical protein
MAFTMGSQQVGSGGAVKLSLDAIEYDTDGFAPASGTSFMDIVVPPGCGGRYDITARARIGSDAGNWTVAILVNDVERFTTVTNDPFGCATVFAPAVTLNDGARVSVAVAHQSGVTQTVGIALVAQRTMLALTLVGGPKGDKGDKGDPGPVWAVTDGDWTPAWYGWSGGAAAHGAQQGRWVRRGRWVKVSGYMQADRGTIAGRLAITGLPFPPASSVVQEWAGSVSAVANFQSMTGYQAGIFAFGATGRLELWALKDGGIVQMDHNVLPPAGVGTIVFTCEYETDAD